MRFMIFVYFVMFGHVCKILKLMGLHRKQSTLRRLKHGVLSNVNSKTVPYRAVLAAADPFFLGRICYHGGCLAWNAAWPDMPCMLFPYCILLQPGRRIRGWSPPLESLWRAWIKPAPQVSHSNSRITGAPETILNILEPAFLGCCHQVDKRLHIDP